MKEREHPGRDARRQRTTVDTSQIVEGNEDQIPVHGANENDLHEEEIRNPPLKNLECGPAAPQRHLFGSTCGTKRAQERICEGRNFVYLNSTLFVLGHSPQKII